MMDVRKVRMDQLQVGDVIVEGGQRFTVLAEMRLDRWPDGEMGPVLDVQGEDDAALMMGRQLLHPVDYKFDVIRAGGRLP
jgi:hypothetical protein